MRKTLSILAVLSVLAATVARGGGTNGGDKTKTAEAGIPTTTAVTPTGTAAAGTSVKVGVKDFAFTLDKNSGPAGKFTFTATNTGATAHEFVVFKTELAPDALPLVSNKSKIDESAQGLDHIDEIGDLNVGDKKSLSVDLQAGAYVFICNLPAHYSQGMYAAFKVQ